jgi:hypothetical protein
VGKNMDAAKDIHKEMLPIWAGPEDGQDKGWNMSSNIVYIDGANTGHN